MLERPVFGILTGLLFLIQFPYIINHHQHFGCFMQLYDRKIANVLVFP